MAGNQSQKAQGLLNYESSAEATFIISFENYIRGQFYGSCLAVSNSLSFVELAMAEETNLYES